MFSFIRSKQGKWTTPIPKLGVNANADRFVNRKARYTDVQHRLPSGATLAAYERYVLAGFKFAANSDALKEERQNAIDMLTPRTLHHYHLKCLDLLKTKTFDQLSTAEVKFLDQFQE